MAKKVELVFVSAPGMGHFMSVVEFAKLLLDVNHHLYITLLLMKPPFDPKLDAYMDSLVSHSNHISTYNSHLKFVKLPDLNDHVGSDTSFLQWAFDLHQTQRPLVKEAIQKVIFYSQSHLNSPRLAAFVLDFLFAPMIDLADEFGIPSYIFYTSGAASLGFHFYTHQQNVNFNELKNSDVELTLPSYAKPVPFKLIPPMSQVASPVKQRREKGLRDAKGILINTFSELESYAVDSLSRGKYPSIYSIGPLLNLNNSDSNIMNWLDKQPPSSVVFLCFGSMGSSCKDQVREIACALGKCWYRFLWSLRPPLDPINSKFPTDYSNLEDELPEGFLDRTSTIGMIIGWALQVAILGHSAIGGFLSHCGWNSVLESIWFGVPIATWPLYVEQQLNAFELVMELGLAVEIKMDYRREVLFNNDEEVEIVSAEDIEVGIRWLMEQDNDVRKRTKEMSAHGMKALVDGGSSHTNLFRFMDDVMQNL